MLEKLKSFLLNDQIFFAIIVVLVGIASFCLGRASVTAVEPKTVVEPNSGAAAVVLKEVIKPEPKETVQKRTSPVAPQSGTLVGSKSGTKYHKLTCPGAKQIKEENKIYFDSIAQAEAAGYKPAANCP